MALHMLLPRMLARRRIRCALSSVTFASVARRPLVRPPLAVRSTASHRPAAEAGSDAVDRVDELAETTVVVSSEGNDQPPERGPLLGFDWERPLALQQRSLEDICIVDLKLG